MIDLSGKVALVTGAAGGIGEGIARVLAKAGAQVALNDLSGRVVETANSIADAIGIEGDICGSDEAATIVGRVTGHFGRLDILVNNAGISGPRGGQKQIGVDELRHVMDVNLAGTYAMCRAVSPLMSSQKAGRIINIASITGLTGFPGSHAYGVSKAAIVMLTRTMALELARVNVTVNCIAPGMIDAPMLGAVSKDERIMAEVMTRIPLGCLGLPDDIGHAAAFLASPAARYVTGATLPVDGGWVAFGGFGAASLVAAI